MSSPATSATEVAKVMTEQLHILRGIATGYHDNELAPILHAWIDETRTALIAARRA